MHTHTHTHTRTHTHTHTTDPRAGPSQRAQNANATTALVLPLPPRFYYNGLNVLFISLITRLLHTARSAALDGIPCHAMALLAGMPILWMLL